MLTDCAIDAGVEMWVARGKYAPVWFYDGFSQYPPLLVTRWAGLGGEPQSDVFVELDEEFAIEWGEHTGDDIDKDDTYRSGNVIGLGALNDAGCPFPVLANLIERVM